LHRGFYHPIWLIEEPESFLHADIIFKLGFLLASNKWLDNIQMLVSTHSPLLLATTKSNDQNINWYHLNNHGIVNQGLVSNWKDDQIKEIGILMGDPNFDIYFRTAETEILVLLEDSKEITRNRLIESGVPVSHKLNGATEQRRYFNVFRSLNISNGRNSYFLVDNDKGIKEFKSAINQGELIQTTHSGFSKYKYNFGVHIIVFPVGFAVEELFSEHDEVLESCVNQIFNHDYTKAAVENNIPANLTRAHAQIRNKTFKGLDDAKNGIRNLRDVKDIFWDKVETENWKIYEDYAKELMELIK